MHCSLPPLESLDVITLWKSHPAHTLPSYSLYYNMLFDLSSASSYLIFVIVMVRYHITWACKMYPKKYINSRQKSQNGPKFCILSAKKYASLKRYAIASRSGSD